MKNKTFADLFREIGLLVDNNLPVKKTEPTSDFGNLSENQLDKLEEAAKIWATNYGSDHTLRLIAEVRRWRKDSSDPKPTHEHRWRTSAPDQVVDGVHGRLTTSYYRCKCGAAAARTISEPK